MTNTAAPGVGQGRWVLRYWTTYCSMLAAVSVCSATGLPRCGSRRPCMWAGGARRIGSVRPQVGEGLGRTGHGGPDGRDAGLRRRACGLGVELGSFRGAGGVLGVDTVYHFALPELVEAVDISGNDEAVNMLGILIDGKRLRDISDLPLDLAI